MPLRGMPWPPTTALPIKPTAGKKRSLKQNNTNLRSSRRKQRWVAWFSLWTHLGAGVMCYWKYVCIYVSWHNRAYQNAVTTEDKPAAPVPVFTIKAIFSLLGCTNIELKGRDIKKSAQGPVNTLIGNKLSTKSLLATFKGQHFTLHKQIHFWLTLFYVTFIPAFIWLK